MTRTDRPLAITISLGGNPLGWVSGENWPRAARVESFGKIDESRHLTKGEEVPLALQALLLQFISKKVLYLFGVLRLMGDLRGVQCRIAAGSQDLGHDDKARTRIDRDARQRRNRRRREFGHAISGGQKGSVVTRETEGQSQAALASRGGTDGDQYVTNCHLRVYWRQLLSSNARLAKIVPKHFLCALECSTGRPK